MKTVLLLARKELASFFDSLMAYLILAAQQHDALPVFSSVMMGFFVPLTVVTLVVMVILRPVAASEHT